MEVKTIVPRDANLDFLIQLVDADDNPLDDPTDELILTCDDIGVVYVRLIVTDSAGNSSYCITTILIEDPLLVCTTNTANAAITLTVQDQNDEDITDVDVYLNGSMMGTVIGMWTDNRPTGQMYTVKPRKNHRLGEWCKYRRYHSYPKTYFRKSEIL